MNKEPFNKFMEHYKNLPCDAFTLAITRQTVEATEEKSNTKDVKVDGLGDKEQDATPVHVLPHKVKQDILHVLDFVNDSLSSTSNERRKDMKLGEYLARHPLVNIDDSFSSYANRIVREKLELVLGK